VNDEATLKTIWEALDHLKSIAGSLEQLELIAKSLAKIAKHLDAQPIAGRLKMLADNTPDCHGCQDQDYAHESTCEFSNFATRKEALK
jgi:N-acyl-D-aspartate/D-glutamate deacylase